MYLRIKRCHANIGIKKHIAFKFEGQVISRFVIETFFSFYTQEVLT